MNDAKQDAPELSSAMSAALFLRRVQLVTLSLLFFVLLLYVLDKFQTILQPLLIAFFIAYLIMPLHTLLVARGIPSILAHSLILFMILAALFGCGIVIYSSTEQMIARLPEYEERLDKLGRQVLLAFEVPDADKWSVRELEVFNAESLTYAVRTLIGTFTGLLTGLAVTFVYLIFLVAERESIRQRLIRAFGEQRGRQLLDMANAINRSITQYLAVKAFNGMLAAVLSVIVLAASDVDFYILWGFLMFLFNFIPYLGSLIAVGLPIVLSFLLLENVASAVTVTILLIAIQQVIGTFLEPRMAGRRLQVSPLLILLSLSFWGLLWGLVGMILAVPLLVVVKSILDNIPETRPIATLMANE